MLGFGVFLFWVLFFFFNFLISTFSPTLSAAANASYLFRAAAHRRQLRVRKERGVF